MRINDKINQGVSPIQHHEPDHDLDLRRAVWFCRVETGTTAKHPLPHIKKVANSEGDLLCCVLWKHNEQTGASEQTRERGGEILLGIVPEDGDQDSDTRGFPGWAFSWPSLVKEITEQEIGDSGPEGGKMLFLPVRNKDWDEDKRFANKEATLAGKAPLYPKGWPGIVTSGTEEFSQEDVFLPAFHGLVAANRGGLGAADLGTRVFEVTDENGLSHWARLQSAWRVVRPRQGGPWGATGEDNALAWQIGPSGGSDRVAGYGLIMGPASELVEAPGPEVGAIELNKFGGTIERPPPGETVEPPEDGGKQVPSGLLAAAGSSRGGPLEVGGLKCHHERGKTADGERINAAHLHKASIYYGGIWDCSLRREDAFEPVLVLDEQGQCWRVHNQVRSQATHATPDGETGPTQGVWNIYLPLTITQPDPPGNVPEGEEGEQIGDPPVIPIPDEGQDEDFTVPRDPKAGSDTSDVRGAKLLETNMELGVPAIVFRASPFVGIEAGQDLRNEPTADMSRLTDRPIVARFEAIAHEVGGGVFENADRDDSPRYGSENRHAPGTLVLLPGNIGGETYAESFSPTNKSVQNLSLSLLKGSRGVEFGLPDPEIGGVKDGFRQDLDSSEELHWRKLDSAGSATDTMGLNSTRLETAVPHDIAESNSPGTPSSGFGRIQPDTDGIFKQTDDGGVTRRVGNDVGPWGSAEDGDRTDASSTSLAAGLHQFGDWTINTGVAITLPKNDYVVVRVAGTLTMTGSATITGQGQGLDGGAAGAAGIAPEGAGGAGGTPTSPVGDSFLMAAGGGGGGGNSYPASGGGGAGGQGHDREFDTSHLPTGGGGAGGAADTIGTAGAANTGITLTMQLDSDIAQTIVWGVGAGGGGGGGGGASVTDDGGIGGPGGHGGGTIVVYAQRLIMGATAEINVNGGIGGDGSDETSGATGSNGGGGSGGSAWVRVGELPGDSIASVSSEIVTLTGGGTIKAEGGAGGTTGGGQIAGGVGADGAVFVELWGNA